MHIHQWIVVIDTGKHLYMECAKCRKRKIRTVYFLGHQPIDKEWLNQ